MGGALGLLHKIVTVTLAKYFTKILIFVFKVHLEIIVKFKNVLFLKYFFHFVFAAMILRCG